MGPRPSLVQDVYFGFEPRLRARRLAPWKGPGVRLALQLDVGETLDDPALAALIEGLGVGVEVIAWEPGRPGQGRATLPPGAIAETRRLAADVVRRFPDGELVLGGRGLSGWLALAAASAEAVSAVVAFAPSLSQAGPTAPQPSPLRSALASALAAPPPDKPVLLLEGRDRPPAEARVVAEWLARTPRAARVLVPGPDQDLLRPPWPQVVAAWAEALAGTRR